MIVAGSASPLLLASAGGYNLTKSLRFRSSASAYLNRTPASATNRQTWTWSAWVKRGSLSSWQIFFGAWDGTGGNDTTRLDLAFEAANTISITGGVTVFRNSTQVFRDPSAWYHIVVVADTTNATAQNRLRIYVNGVEITNWGTNNTVTQNTTLAVNNNASHVIGARGNSPTQYFDGYMTEINFVDGQALTPSSFGQTSTTTGVWIPKKYTGTYGTNGFYLPFTNTASTSTLGNDFSGNSNTWTVNNISLTSGSTYDSMTDVPTLTSATTANYAVLNPLAKAFSNGGSGTTSNGNLTITYSATNWYGHKSTIAVSSGKWYYEVTNTTGTSFVMCGISLVTVAAETNAGVYRYRSNGEKINTSYTSYGATWSTAGDICGIAFDLDAGTITFYKNGVSQGTAFTSIPAGEYAAEVIVENGSTANVNFGQRPFAYTPPTGFVALNTFNLPTPTIGATASTTANKYFDATTFDGVTGGGTVTNSGSMQPDFVWMKVRNNGNNHELADSVRGTPYASFSNLTNAEVSDTRVSAFNSNGFSYGTNSNSAITGRTVVGWQWRASNATAVTNTAGSITSSVSANTTAGFSIVTYTGTGANATVGHGLGVAPSMVIVKRRPTAGSNWAVWHTGIANTEYLLLNSTIAKTTNTAFWNSTSPTSTVFSVGSDPDTNGTVAIVAYCFAQIAGYSAFGSYTGNGSTDGPFIFTGFRPRYVLIKSTVEASNWLQYDTARMTYNKMDTLLYPSLSNAEGTDSTYAIDVVSNGFKIRGTGQYGGYNNNGNAYIYMAFAENPFKYANAR